MLCHCETKAVLNSSTTVFIISLLRCIFWTVLPALTELFISWVVHCPCNFLITRVTFSRWFLKQYFPQFYYRKLESQNQMSCMKNYKITILNVWPNRCATTNLLSGITVTESPYLKTVKTHITVNIRLALVKMLYHLLDFYTTYAYLAWPYCILLPWGFHVPHLISCPDSSTADSVFFWAKSSSTSIVRFQGEVPHKIKFRTPSFWK